MTNSPRDYRTQPPQLALILGFSGLIPFVTLALAAIYGTAEQASIALSLLQAYAIAILSFMGGVHWGLGMTNRLEGKAAANRQLVVSVVPALFAVATTVLPLAYQLFALCIGFGGLLAYDLQMVKKAYAPAWYPTLRWPLTLITLTCLASAGWASL